VNSSQKRKAASGRTYEELIRCSLTRKEPRRVKLDDLEDKMDLRRLATLLIGCNPR